MTLHFFHDWTKWSTVAEGPLYRYYFRMKQQIQTGIYERQKRSCIECGKSQIRTIETEGADE